jgi:4-hydroxy-tetrahydrodipicolinate synthase
MSVHPRGVFSAALTPVKADLSPDLYLLGAHCKNLISEGCHGIALLGTTGEANHFSLGERKTILESVLAAGLAGHQVMPGTGVCALPESVELTRHALSVGVETVVLLPPFYFKNVPDSGLIDAYSWIIEQVNDPRLKVVLYHVPPISQIPIPFGVVEELARRYPETIVGVKDSSGDHDHISRMIEAFPKLSILVGADPYLLPALPHGAAGCITATSNVTSPDLRFIFDHYADPARKAEVDAAQERCVEVRAIGARLPQISSLKAMLARRTGHDGWLRMRPPLLSLTAEERTKLYGWLDEYEARQRSAA